MRVPLVQLVDIPQRGDARGALSVAELGGVLPFAVRPNYERSPLVWVAFDRQTSLTVPHMIWTTQVQAEKAAAVLNAMVRIPVEEW